MRKVYIDFMGNRKWLFAVSGVLIVISIGALLIRGLNFGIEFKGGTTIVLPYKQGLTVESVRSELKAAGMTDAIVQPVQQGSTLDGFLVRSSISDTAKANQVFQTVASKLNVRLLYTSPSPRD